MSPLLLILIETLIIISVGWVVTNEECYLFKIHSWGEIKWKDGLMIKRTWFSRELEFSFLYPWMVTYNYQPQRISWLLLDSISTCTHKHVCVCVCVRAHTHTQEKIKSLNDNYFIKAECKGESHQTLVLYLHLPFHDSIPSVSYYF